MSDSVNQGRMSTALARDVFGVPVALLLSIAAATVLGAIMACTLTH